MPIAGWWPITMAASTWTPFASARLDISEAWQSGAVFTVSVLEDRYRWR